MNAFGFFHERPFVTGGGSPGTGTQDDDNVVARIRAKIAADASFSSGAFRLIDFDTLEYSDNWTYVSPGNTWTIPSGVNYAKFAIAWRRLEDGGAPWARGYLTDGTRKIVETFVDDQNAGFLHFSIGVPVVPAQQYQFFVRVQSTDILDADNCFIQITGYDL